MAKKAGWLVTAFLAAGPMICPVYAAFEQAVEVVQPIETWEGIYISTVTVVAYFSETPPGHSIWFIDAPSCVLDNSGESENRNVANLFRITTKTDDYWENKLGDTMRVYIDFTRFVSDSTTRGGYSSDAVAKATFECLLLNASRDRTGFDYDKREEVTASYLDVRVIGSEKFKAWEHVYSFEDDLADVPRTKLFQF
jgi:hypothetical protein